MTLKSKLKVKSLGVFVFSIFYAVAGAAQVFLLAISNFALIHVGVLGFLSLITAFGLVRMRKWSVPLVVILFFLGATFSATVLYASFSTDVGGLLLQSALIAYVIIMMIAFIYVVAKRKNFQ